MIFSKNGGFHGFYINEVKNALRSQKPLFCFFSNPYKRIKKLCNIWYLLSKKLTY